MHRAPHDWLLPFAIAATTLLAAHVAWALATFEGYVDPCVPYLDGCASVSRVARHGTANAVFKVLMIPCALLQILHWQRERGWLTRASGDTRVGSTLAWLGAIAGIALVVYLVALGSEGMLYRFMRRYGITFYFAATFVAQLVFLRALLQRVAPPVFASSARGMTRVCVAMLLLGLGSVATSGLVADPDTKDRLENVLEWWFGFLLALWFLLEARVARLASGRSG